MKRFPFLTLQQALTALRVITALVFLLHAVMRFVNHTMPIFGQALEQKGFVYGLSIVWVLTIYEIAGSLLLLFGKAVRWVSLGFIFILVMGIILIHFSLGWFVGEHGTGGCEYSVVLIFALVVLAAWNGKPVVLKGDPVL